jgi:hypothetical protein
MANQSSHTVKGKVKSGCRTCKTRRVKCDEGRPACQRCVSTGRVCEGYGIWGGGGNGNTERTDTLRTRPGADIMECVLSSHFGKMSIEQKSSFTWFRYRTCTKFSHPLITPFWDTLVLQACAVEPAILHAVLALGSAHRRHSYEDGKPYTALDSQQVFMLREYSKAIHSLQPHFSNWDRRSVHVALATCALFTFMEYLLGRYAAANAHLHSGLRLLSDVYSPIDHSGGRVAATKSRRYVDVWIIEVFMRLHVQAAILGHGLTELYYKLPRFPDTPIPSVFQSTNQAAHYSK